MKKTILIIAILFLSFTSAYSEETVDYIIHFSISPYTVSAIYDDYTNETFRGLTDRTMYIAGIMIDNNMDFVSIILLNELETPIFQTYGYIIWNNRSINGILGTIGEILTTDSYIDEQQASFISSYLDGKIKIDKKGKCKVTAKAGKAGYSNIYIGVIYRYSSIKGTGYYQIY